MSREQKNLGAQGEEAARQFLKHCGYKILARNFNCPVGEIDLICYGDGTLVFVEVKTRAEDVAADPEENITPRKQRRMERAARTWLTQHHEPNCAYRFDAVSVVIPEAGETRVRHIVEAFLPARG